MSVDDDDFEKGEHEENEFLTNEKKKDPGEVARELLAMAKHQFKNMNPPQVVGYAMPSPPVMEFGVRIIENGYIITYNDGFATKEKYAHDGTLNDDVRAIIVLMKEVIEKYRQRITGGPLGR